MVLSSMQLQKVSVTLWFRRLQGLVLRSVLSVFLNLRSAECVCSYYGLRDCYKQINQIKYHESATLGENTEHFTTNDGFKVMAYARYSV